MDDNSEDEFEENFGELDDEIVPDLEAVHEISISMLPKKTDSGFSDSAKQSRTTTYATN